MNATEPMLAAALEYAERGWSVFPLAPGGKRPATANGFYDATTDPAQIRAWWQETPYANIGLPMGAVNGLTALDEDVKDGARGRETLTALLDKYGAHLDEYAQTVTASGGRHFIAAYDELARHGVRRFGPGLDCVNDGGYLVAPPSIVGGKAYQWVVPPDALLPFPGWLRTEQDHNASEGPSAGSFNEPGWADLLIAQGVDKGERDYQAWRLICHARWTGKSEADCVEMVTLFGARCRPPFDPATDRNIAQKIRRAYRRPAPEHLGAGVMARKRIDGAGAGAGAGEQGEEAQGDAWGPLLPLPSTRPAVLPLVREMLPERLYNWAADIAYRTQSPIDFAAVSAIIALATLLGGRIFVYPKKRDNWVVAPNLWGVLVGPPSLLKTPAQQAALKVLHRMAVEAREAHDAQMEGWKKLEAKYKVKEASLKKKLGKAYESEDEIAIAEAEKKLDDLAKTLPPKPILKRFVTNDSTIEKLGMILNENKLGVCLHRDELSGLFAQMTMKGHEQDRAIYLECWDGLQGKAIDRVERGSLWIERCILSILGSIQPGPLERALLQAYGDDGLGSDGFLERFQLAVWPDPVELGYMDEMPSATAEHYAEVLFSAATNLKPDTIVRFDEAAQARFAGWYTGLMQAISDPRLEPVMQNHLSKYRSLIPSLAAVFQLASEEGLQPVGVDPCPKIGLAALEMAVSWGRYLRGHARRLYWPIIGPQGEQVARRLAVKLPVLTRDYPGGFTAREVARYEWIGLRNTPEIGRALLQLSRGNWVRELPAAKREGRPTERWVGRPGLVVPEEYGW